jgi:hypothetical protein
LVIYNRLTKYTYFISWKETGTAENTVYIFYQYIYTNYKIPEEIVSDCNPRFISVFWKLLIGLIGTCQAVSIVFYLQSDKQTEKTNQVLEQYLQYYINYKQTNWV